MIETSESQVVERIVQDAAQRERLEKLLCRMEKLMSFLEAHRKECMEEVMREVREQSQRVIDQMTARLVDAAKSPAPYYPIYPLPLYPLDSPTYPTTPWREPVGPYVPWPWPTTGDPFPTVTPTVT